MIAVHYKRIWPVISLCSMNIDHASLFETAFIVLCRFVCFCPCSGRLVKKAGFKGAFLKMLHASPKNIMYLASSQCRNTIKFVFQPPISPHDSVFVTCLQSPVTGSRYLVWMVYFSLTFSTLTMAPFFSEVSNSQFILVQICPQVFLLALCITSLDPATLYPITTTTPIYHFSTFWLWIY